MHSDNMQYLRKLPTPEEIKAQFPISEKCAALKSDSDRRIAEVFTGNSDKFLLIIGPCSSDREDAVMEYVSRLRRVQEKVSDKLILIPRIYTNKPRTTGQGYKGMLHQPNPTEKPDMLEGLIAIRKLHTDVIEQTGFATADEMLYPENYRYLNDILGYIAIGARSSENQQHRLVSSGMNIPVGMKNPTSGDLSVMLNAIVAAQGGHTFLYSGWEVTTQGNPLCHAILRGSVNKHGNSLPNYHYEDLIRLYDMYTAKGLKNVACIVDCNHSNSGKQYLEQIRIAKEVLHSCRHSESVRSMIKGLMIESYLEDGCQRPEDGVYGKSITDPCLGWEKSERLILEIADLL